MASDDRPGDFLTLFNFKGKTALGERGVKDIEKERYEFVKRLQQAAKRVGANNWADLGSHTPRKSMVFDLYEKTGDINQTAEIVRHSDVATTKRYLMLEEQEKMATFKANYG